MFKVKIARNKEGKIKSMIAEDEKSIEREAKVKQELIILKNIELHNQMADAFLLKKSKPNLINEAIENFVDTLKNRIKVYTWADDNIKEFWVYEAGIYTTNGVCVIEREVRNILGDIYSEEIFNKILARIRIDTYIKKEEFLARALNHLYEINANNCVIKIDPVTYNITTAKHSPENIFLWKLDINYDVEARCPEIDKFFEDTLAVATDRDALDEVLGTTLQPNEITKKAVISYGEPDTAKTTTGNLLLKFFGKDNCANLTLQQITEKDFLVSNLFGKIANIAGDLSQDIVKNIDVFKKVTGGDTFSSDRKYKTIVSFANQAKMFFNMNTLPRIYNADKATWNRMMPFKYIRIFVEKNVYDKLTDTEKKNYGIKDPHILTKLTTSKELSGLLNRAIEGLIRYYKNGKFSYAKGVDEYSKEWIRLSDSFMAFCTTYIEHGNMGCDFITRKDLASKYNRYCKEHNVRSVGDKSMKATLSNEYGVYVEGYTTNSNSERVWEGIKWKPFINGSLNNE